MVTFKSAEELKKLYESLNVTPNKEVITYCGIGERASYTWFVLKYLLGYPNVKSTMVHGLNGAILLAILLKNNVCTRNPINQIKIYYHIPYICSNVSS